MINLLEKRSQYYFATSHNNYDYYRSGITALCLALSMLTMPAGVFVLCAIFSSFYPAKPPEVRFLTPVSFQHFKYRILGSITTGRSI